MVRNNIFAGVAYLVYYTYLSCGLREYSAYGFGKTI